MIHITVIITIVNRNRSRAYSPSSSSAFPAMMTVTPDVSIKHVLFRQAVIRRRANAFFALSYDMQRNWPHIPMTTP